MPIRLLCLSLSAALASLGRWPQKVPRRRFTGLALASLLLAGCQAMPAPPAPPGSLRYTQFAEAQGIIIKAPASVDPRAVEAAQKVINQMLANARPDIVARMETRQAALAIIPADQYITALPEFAPLSGKRDPNGNLYDSMRVRGVGAISNQPVTSTSEENLLRLRSDPFRKIHLAIHEVAHAVKNLGFSEEDRANWLAIYRNAKKNNLFPKTYAIKDVNEYFAELSRFYFNETKKGRGPKTIRKEDPDAFAFLQSIYRSGAGV